MVYKTKSYVICSSLSESQTRGNLSLMMMIMLLRTKKIEKRFFHRSSSSYVNHNDECGNSHNIVRIAVLIVIFLFNLRIHMMVVRVAEVARRHEGPSPKIMKKVRW